MPRPARLPILLLVLLSGCEVIDTDDDDDDGPPACEGDTQERAVLFETVDEVLLEADYQPAATQGRGAVVLVHMIPPSNDRTGYPQRVRDQFRDLDLTILNLDRRGAGEAAGDPLDAYEGSGGLWDLEAALGFLISDFVADCPVDPEKILLVGASNGTTSVLDYAVEHEADLPEPTALSFMSPGRYTENQNFFRDNDDLEDLPIQWLYPTDEDYSSIFVGQSERWEFVERGGAHGTRMFDAAALEADTVSDMIDWMTLHLDG
jgi:pimeloyl-ACP methyl ester carboxylesterase